MADFDATRALMGDADESYDSRADYWKARAQRAEADNERLRAERDRFENIAAAERGWRETACAERDALLVLLKQVEWMPDGKCPVCLGWETVKGMGENARTHRKDCELKSAIDAARES